MLLYTLFILLSFYALLSGVKDAVLWSKKGAESFKFNEHILFVAERATVYLSVLIAVLSVELTAKFVISFLVILLASLLAFPFLHNGALYYSRNKIEPELYTKGFFSEPSETSTAKYNFSFRIRTILFGVAIFLVIIVLFSY